MTPAAKRRTRRERKAAADERAAIVAYLESLANPEPDGGHRNYPIAEIADRIEAGAHHDR